MAERIGAAAVSPPGLRRVLALGLLSVLVLAGCTAAEQPQRPSVTVKVPAQAPPVDPAVTYASQRLSTMTLREKVSSLFMMHLAGTDAAQLHSFAETNGLGGIILMGDNIPADASQLAGITAVLAGDPGLPLLIGIDQEGGVVERINLDGWQAAWQLRNLPPEASREAFTGRAGMLASLGVSVNFGIVADVTADPSSFIFDRSYGGTAEEAAARVAAAVEGERGLVLSTLKHFPGHGVAPGDSHATIPTTAMGYEEWRATEAPPFIAGIEAGAEFVMFGHLQFDAVEALPASLSPRWHEILRSDLGFQGIAITDDLRMLHDSGRPEYADPSENAIRAVLAGNTMLLFVGGADPATVISDVVGAVESGRIPERVVNDAARRLLELRRTQSGQTGRFVRCLEECSTAVN